MSNNYDKQQVVEQRQTNLILIINTIATVLTGFTTLILTVLQFYK